MVARLRAWLPWSAGLLLTVAGCRSGPIVLPDSHSTATGEESPRALRASTQFNIAPLQQWAEPVPISHEQPGLEEGPAEENPAEDQPPEKQPDKPTPLADRLQIPTDLPGSSVPVITLPDLKPGNEKARKEAIDKYFPPLPALPDLPISPPAQDGHPVRLSALEQMALTSSPLIRQASADVDAARGVAIQAGLYPNPRFGYQGDSINQGSTAGEQGAFIEQTLKTGKKLQVSRAAAEVDVTITELALRRTEIDLKTQVRRGYFAVLAAERSLRVARAFAGLTTEVFTIQVTRLRLGQAATHEALQARVLARQARAVFLQAQNRHSAAWRQLAVTLGRPDLAAVALAGDLDRPVPRFVTEAVLDRVLSNHTDVSMAENSLSKAQLRMRLAEIMPVPDIDLHYSVQYDKTAQPNNAMHGVSVGVQLPLWNRNQGGLLEAGAHLSRAGDERERVRNDLIGQVAAAFEKYDNHRLLVLMYRDQIVPDQARAYRNIYRGYDTAPETLNFNDVITAQQTLSDTIRNYVEALGNLWGSVVDIANLLQMDELFDDAGKPDAVDHCPLPQLDPLPKILLAPQAELPAPAQEQPAEAPVIKRSRVSFELRQVPDTPPAKHD